MVEFLQSKRILRSIIRTALMAAVVFGTIQTSAAQSITVTGKVSDTTGQVLPGVTVVVAGSTTGVITDINGLYSIKVKSAESILEFSYLGYAPQNIKVGTKSVIDVILQADNVSLEEVVVIGYSQTTKTDLTGSVGTVKMNDVKDIPVTSIDQALQGRVAGAEIMSTSGDPSASTSIRIRGTRSITASNEPLIVVDGIIDAVSDLNDINSADIESVSVLKDASSTAIYGSRGANGVIIVTTKKGNAGSSTKPAITFKTEWGVSQIARKLDTMNAAEYAQYYNEVRAGNDNYVPETVQKFTYKDPESLGEGTNWIDEITRNALYQNHNLSIAKRTKGGNLYGSIGYTNSEGIIKDSGFERLTGRFSGYHQFNKWFKLAMNASISYRKQDANKAAIGGSNFYNGATYLAPTLSPTDSYNPFYSNGVNFNNPVVCIDQNTNFNEQFNQTYTLGIELKPVRGLTIESKNTVYLFQKHEFKYFPGTLPAKNEGEGGQVFRSEYETRTFSTDNTATYKKKFNNGHYFDIMGGFSASSRLFNYMEYSAKGYLVDDLLWNNLGGLQSKETITPASWNRNVVKMSAFARLNYNYKKRYYLTVTARGDGSSNFAANHKWGFFPSVALKWNIANERWMRRARNIDDFSLRFSAGRTGNDAISAYRSLEEMKPNTNGYIFDGVQSTYYYLSRLASDNLTWETTDMYNLALDMSFFNDRLRITAEGYLSYTKDLLLSVQRPSQTGFTSYMENVGKTSNKGVELSIESRNIAKKNFTWSTTLTVSHNKQMVEDIGSRDFVAALSSPGNGSYMMYGYVAGRPLNSLWGFKYGGVYHNDEEIERNKVTKAYACPTTKVIPGTPRYVDINHDGILDNNDLSYLGNADPYLYGGFQNTFNIHGLKLGVYFTYSLGGKIYNYSELRMAGSYTTNQYRYMTDAWHPVRNPQSNYPRAGITEIHVPSTLQVHDASYLRLSNVSLSYTFDLRKKVRWLRDITLGVNGENLFLWSTYNGFDPDVSTESDGSTLRRVDMGAYPRARKVIFSLQIRY